MTKKLERIEIWLEKGWEWAEDHPAIMATTLIATCLVIMIIIVGAGLFALFMIAERMQ